MDLDHHEDSDFEPTAGAESHSEDEDWHNEKTSKGRHPFKPSVLNEGVLTTGVKPSAKWDRLQPLYNDRYLELFQGSAGSEPQYFRGSEYRTSQIGAVTWEADEKVRFFEALPIIGSHSLPLLALRVGTKTQLEIRSYLNQLKKAETDRQLFEKQTKNISKADIPSAIEIGPDCEAHLEQAADALAAFQEQYDHAFGQQETNMPFVINHEVASWLDEKTEKSIDSDDDSEGEAEVSVSAPYELFHLLTFIDLSEKVFMHGSQRNADENWRAFAEDGETPAMTQQVVSEFHDLVINLLRRLVQTTLFLTQSRLRASTTQHQTPARAVVGEDIHAALTILKSESSLWDYWTKLPRRFGFRVVSGSNRKGDNVRKALSYDEVEAILAPRRSSGRRRSLSITSAASTETSARSEASSIAGDVKTTSEDTDVEVVAEETSSHSPDEQTQEGTDSIEAEVTASKHARTLRVAPNKRKRLLGEEMDRYLEEMDQQARQEEEARLSSLLAVEGVGRIKQEQHKLGRRPKAPRKSVEELPTWAPIYQAEWESHPRALSEDGSNHADATITTYEQQEDD